MKKNKIALFALSLVAVAAVGVGSTLAYFTDSEETETNVFTMGAVDIELDEEWEPEDGEDIVPGDEIDKVPKIIVEDGNCYIRFRVDIELTNADDFSEAEKAERVSDILNGIMTGEGDEAVKFVDVTDWVYNEVDGYYYVQGQAEAGTAFDIFHTVNVPATWGNAEAGIGFDIDISAEAIQAENFEPVTNEAGVIIGWGNVTVEELQEEVAPN